MSAVPAFPSLPQRSDRPRRHSPCRRACGVRERPATIGAATTFMAQARSSAASSRAARKRFWRADVRSSCTPRRPSRDPATSTTPSAMGSSRSGSRSNFFPAEIRYPKAPPTEAPASTSPVAGGTSLVVAAARSLLIDQSPRRPATPSCTPSRRWWRSESTTRIAVLERARPWRRDSGWCGERRVADERCSLSVACGPRSVRRALQHRDLQVARGGVEPPTPWFSVRPGPHAPCGESADVLALQRLASLPASTGCDRFVGVVPLLVTLLVTPSARRAQAPLQPPGRRGAALSSPAACRGLRPACWAVAARVLHLFRPLFALRIRRGVAFPHSLLRPRTAPTCVTPSGAPGALPTLRARPRAGSWSMARGAWSLMMWRSSGTRTWSWCAGWGRRSSRCRPCGCCRARPSHGWAIADGSCFRGKSRSISGSSREPFASGRSPIAPQGVPSRSPAALTPRYRRKTR